jgi:hypothetical protein
MGTYDEQDIRERAYALWAARGCPSGSPEEDWLAAEAQLSTEAQSVAELPKTRKTQEPQPADR